MSVRDLLGRLRDVLRSAGVPHMLTGSYASSVHGAPRASQDIDIVIAPTRQQLLALLELFPDTEYIEDAAGVIRLQGNALDRNYIARWIGVLGLQEQWNEALARAV